MNLSFYIAKRYLFSKKSHNAINIISMISICGIAIATMAMVCTLSIFNGFTKLVSDSFSIMDPDLQIIPAKGKVFDASSAIFQKIKKLPEVAVVSETVEDNALVKYGERQDPVLIKGVSDQFKEMVDTKRLVTSGEFSLREGDVDFCVAGIGVAINLGLRTDNITPIEIYSPKRDVKIQLANPANAFTTAYTYPAGVFTLNQAKYDDQIILVSLDLARELFRYNNEVTSLDIKLKENVSANDAESKIQKQLGYNFIVKNRFEQQADSFRMVNIEKWVTFLILSFILIIAVFNVVSSLSMLILDKSADIDILRNMGAENNLITRIFKIEGWLISMSGAIAGIVIGLVLCLIQQHFGILKLGQTPGAFIVDSYPVEVIFTDILFVFITVSIIGGLIVLYPVNNLKKRLKQHQ
ncbi:FtsX-like permease family protein [Dysgonomonas capnocytophagoides]|uniref:FtsX-like permease family protein n=1 Tax=Dysgonomonas capnocytophagoides TaxID=45254 RepID=A0A4Y8KVT7_9BACT|nr:ABC transporter permease [Dysgonomonas capnocytophagoides]TFD94183.1 FtsX-like permease family protein [Dysgonomonas capnocytophagoides]